jgi:hypothetical protein
MILMTKNSSFWALSKMKYNNHHLETQCYNVKGRRYFAASYFKIISLQPCFSLTKVLLNNKKAYLTFVLKYFLELSVEN